MLVHRVLVIMFYLWSTYLFVSSQQVEMARVCKLQEFTDSKTINLVFKLIYLLQNKPIFYSTNIGITV